MKTKKLFTLLMSCLLVFFISCGDSKNNSGATQEKVDIEGNDKLPADGSKLDGASSFEGFEPEGASGTGARNSGEMDTAAGAPEMAADDSAEEGKAAGGSEREVEEGNIYSVYKGKYLINLNSYRGLQVIDIADPFKPEFKSQLRFQGNPMEMYFKDEKAFILMRDALEYKIKAGLKIDRYQGAVLKVVDLKDLSNPVLLGTFRLEGNILSSRRVGDVFYIVSNKYEYVSGQNYQESNKTYIESFQFDSVKGAVAIDQETFDFRSNQIQGFSSALLVAQNDYNNGTYKATIHYVDISDPKGDIKIKPSVTVNGQVQNKFGMDLYKNTLRVVTNGWVRNANGRRGVRRNYLTTFDYSNTSKPKELAELQFAEDDSLFATIFDGPRAFFVTYKQVDPLFAMDLSDPKSPKIASFLDNITGWNNFFRITHNGERLVGIGIDDADSTRRMAVSLFDISDIYDIKMLSRTHLTKGYSWSNANWDDKAFSVLEDEGLVLVPYSGYDDKKGEYLSGIRIVELSKNTVLSRGNFAQKGTVERTFTVNKDVTNISQEEMTILDIADKDNPKEKSRLELAPNVEDFYVFGSYGVEKVVKYRRYNSPGTVVLRTVDMTNVNSLDSKPVSELEIKSQGKMVRWGNYLVDIVSTGSSWDYGSGNQKAETTVTVYDFSDPTKPKELSKTTTDRYFQSLNNDYYGGYYGGPYMDDAEVGVSSSEARMVAEDCMDCGRGGYYYGGNELTAEEVSNGLVFYSFKAKRISKGTKQKCYKNDYAEEEPEVEGGVSAPKREVKESCYDYEEYDYQYEYGFHHLNLKDPKNPVFDHELIRKNPVKAMVSNGKQIFLSFREAGSKVGKGMQKYKSYYQLIDFSGSKVAKGAKINIPGELLKIDGAKVFTIERYYDETDWSMNMKTHYLFEYQGKAFLMGSKTHEGRDFRAVKIDDRNNLYISSGYTYQQKRTLFGEDYWRDPASNEVTLDVFDFDSKKLDKLSTFTLDQWANLSRVVGERVFLQVTGGYLLVDYVDASNPRGQNFFAVMGYSRNISTKGDELFIAAGKYGLYNFDLNKYPLITLP